MINQEKLAECIGVILGDGHLHKKRDCITIVGSLEDLYYYEDHVIPLLKSLFPGNPRLRKRNDRNAYYIDFNSKEAMEYLSNKIGLVRGNKVNAKIPDIIKNNMDLIPHFLRGLFDTDGCLKFSKQTKNINYYPRVQFAFRASNFAEEVGIILKKLKFNIGSWKENRFNGLLFYQISGKANLERWMTLVGSNNLVHKTKYLIWQERGFYIPKSSLKSRIEALTLNMI